MMKPLITLAIILGIWLVLGKFVLPKLGIKG
jgi:hypothetical protein